MPYLLSETDICWFDKIPETPRNQNDPINEDQQKLFADFWVSLYSTYITIPKLISNNVDDLLMRSTQLYSDNKGDGKYMRK